MSNILELKNISKEYPGVIALDDVSVSFKEGEVHGLVGENGAGKSTLIKIITGAIDQTKGDVFFDGKKLPAANPKDRMDLGIAAIYQEFNLFGELSVAENIFYNRCEKKYGLIDFKKTEENAQKVIDRLGVKIDPKTLVKNLTVGYQQLVEIAKAISRKVRLMIMDEPSAPLTNNELENLFKIVKQFKNEGVTVLYISHRLEEIFDLCDRVSVFRDGKHIVTQNVGDTNKDDLVRLMVNRELSKTFPAVELSKSEKVIQLKGVSTKKLKNVNLDVFRGERLGLAGLVGSGRTEIAKAIFGEDKLEKGEIFVRGEKVNFKSPRDAVKAGIGLIPEDRKREGALLHMSIRDNISFARLSELSSWLGLIDKQKENESCEKQISDLQIKTPSKHQLAKNLSGGNQQKVVLGKWLSKSSDILIFDEPTRGIDVGAKQEIYNLINNLAKQGKVVIIISSEMPELIGMSDRIVVMHEGELMGELVGSEISQEKIIKLASGIVEEKII